MCVCDFMSMEKSEQRYIWVLICVTWEKVMLMARLAVKGRSQAKKQKRKIILTKITVYKIMFARLKEK